MKSPPRPPLPAELEGLPAVNRFGKFACIRKIGSGGMGEVWQAWDTELRRWVALKLVRGTDQEMLARFRREALLAAQFTHPHAAAIYEFGESRGRPYIAMQFVEGETLKRRRPADPREWVPLMIDAARAVHAAHDRGIIHRDLKPDNFMVDGDHLFVMDFGLARPVDANSQLSQDGQVVGTPSYMSPEQARALEIGPPADVWGLGATMYEVIAGRPPFKGATVFETVRQLLADDPAPIPADSDLCAIVMKCLEKAPRDRYGSALELAEDLERWMRHEPIRARKHSPGYRLRKWTQKHRTLALVGAAAAVLLLVVGALMWRHAGQNRDLVIRQLRETAETSLAAALELRRSGNLEGMEKFGKRLEEACARASAALPDDPEPWYLLARLHRARMDDARAGAALEEARRRDPRHAPSRYERVILTTQQLHQRAVQLADEARLELEIRMRIADVLPGLLAQDPEAVRLQESLQSDLEVVLADLKSLASAEVECARGLAAWAQRRDEPARLHLEEALKRNPDLEEATQVLVQMVMLAGRRDEAARRLDEAVVRDRGQLLFHRLRANARMGLAEDRRCRGEDPTAAVEAAVAAAEEIVRQFPGSPFGYLARGVARSTLATWSGERGADVEPLERAMLADFDRVLQMSPDAVETRRRRGVLFAVRADRAIRAGRSPETDLAAAIRDHRDALALAPGNAPVLAELGSALMTLGTWKINQGLEAATEMDEAIRVLGKAIEARPWLHRPWQLRGITKLNSCRLVLRAGRREGLETVRQAIADFDQALGVHPKDVQTLVNRALAHGELARLSVPPMLDRFEAAMQDLDLAEKLAPDHDLVHFLRSQMLTNRAVFEAQPEASYQEAIRCLDRVMELNPSRVETWGRRAGVRLSLGIWRSSIRQDPSADFAAGVEDARKALADQPNHSDTLVTLAALRINQSIEEKHAGRNRPELLREAVDIASRATKASPGNLHAWNVLTQAWSETGVQAQSRREDGRPALRESLAAAREAVHLSPQDARSSTSLAMIHMLLGVLSQERGEDPTLPFDEALAEIARAIELGPHLAEVWEIAAITRVQYAEWLWKQNRPNESLFRAAVAAAARYEVPRYKFRDVLGVRLTSNLLLAMLLDRAGRPEEGPLRAALAALDAMIARDPGERERQAGNYDYCRRGLEKLGKKP